MSVLKPERTKDVHLVPKAPRDAAIGRLNEALAHGALDCPVGRVHDLAEAGAAPVAVEAGAGAVQVRCA